MAHAADGALQTRGDQARWRSEGVAEMPKFQVTVADEEGHKLYDESIEASGPMEVCAKAVADAKTDDVAESEEQMDTGLVLPFTMGVRVAVLMSRRPLR